MYTDGETGCSTLKRNRKGSEKAQPTGKGADSVLGNLVTEIESLYGESISGSPAPTRHGSEPSVTCDSKFFAEQANKLRNPEPAIPPEDTVLRRAWADYIESLLYSRPPRLRDADAVRLEKTAQVKARWEGIKIHSRFQLWNAPALQLEVNLLERRPVCQSGEGAASDSRECCAYPSGTRPC